MSIFLPEDKNIASLIGALGQTNPFFETRIALEREILQSNYTPIHSFWYLQNEIMGNNKNVIAILELAKSVAQKARIALLDNVLPQKNDITIYEELVWYLLYYEFENPFYNYICATMQGDLTAREIPNFGHFKKRYNHFFSVPQIKKETLLPPEMLYAMFFNLRRAFHFTFRHILGSSAAAAKLRGEVWQSIFTHDFKRYQKILFNKMHTITTLITGPSGTGKDLVASAIGLSRFIPLNKSKTQFTEDFRETYHPINLSALSPSILEGELFGYVKGAFTGAAKDSAGFLENKPIASTIFLDEIGEISLDIQVKLLRTLQSGEFYRLGDRCPRQFNGKVIAATNRCLNTEIENNKFRKDLYYRLCSDLIVTPTLKQQVQNNPDELAHIIGHVARKVVGSEHYKPLATQTLDWINKHIDRNYTWPGNMRELEQCVKNILVRKNYIPLSENKSNCPTQNLQTQMQNGSLTAEELLQRYCKMVFNQNKSYTQTAKLLGIDRRTVKAKVTTF